jgi:hypothetical protein
MSKGSIEWEQNAQDGLVLRIKPGMGNPLAAAEVIQHAMNANKEMMLAARSLLDLAIQRMEEKQPAGTQSSTRIKVD